MAGSAEKCWDYEWLFPWKHGLLRVTGAAEKCCDCEWLFPWKQGVASNGGFRGKVLEL